MSGHNIAINVEVGDGYEPSDRLRAALVEVDAALQEAHGDDTSGFWAFETEMLQFTFHTITWNVVDGSLATVVAPRDSASGRLTGRRQYEPQ